MAKKDALAKGLVNEIVYDLMVRSDIHNVRLDDNTSLANKLQEIVNALNGKVKRSDIVNDLVSGGQDVPLSAEMGKHLKYIVDNLPTGGGNAPTHLSQLVNDAGFITSEIDPTVPSWAKEPQKPVYSSEEIRLLSDETSPMLVDKLQEIVTALNSKVTPDQLREAVEPLSFETDETLTLKDGVLSVNTTDQMEQDNTLPMTSAGVYAQVGNIEALLKTI